MAQFLKVHTVSEVFALLNGIEPMPAEFVDLDAACGRILAEPITAPEPVPHFARALMDGYAVRARDTFGASESLPALLEIGGEVLMGEGASQRVEAGRAIAVATGGMLPPGSDAVVMVEYTSFLDEKTIEVIRPVAPGDHVLGAGEDIREGEALFAPGRRLRAQDIGGLAALGITRVRVVRRPRVAILSTGDEIVPVATRALRPGKIRDINTYTLSGLVRESGGVVGARALVLDRLEDLVDACRNALADHDMLILSGGSSAGARDFTVKILEGFEDAELLVHGVAVRPGKPTILARIGTKLFWGLPGQPVSALMICKAFVQPSLAVLQGAAFPAGGEGLARGTLRAFLTRKLPSVHGRTDFVPVTLSGDSARMQATPIFGKSAMISTLTRSDGFIVISEHVEGLDQGTEVAVSLFSHNVLPTEI